MKKEQKNQLEKQKIQGRIKSLLNQCNDDHEIIRRNIRDLDTKIDEAKDKSEGFD